MQRNQQPDLWKGLAAGLAGGLIASWVMNQFQSAWTRAANGFEKPHGAQSMQPSEGEDTRESKQQEDDATVKAAEVISKHLLGRELKDSEKKTAGAIVHYAFGTAVGGLYGSLVEFFPKSASTAGLPFGVVFWAVADEAMVPLFGLSKGSFEYSLHTHVYALTSHLVYGATTELTRRTLREKL